MSAEGQVPEGVDPETGEVIAPEVPEESPEVPFEEPEPTPEETPEEPGPEQPPEAELTDEQIAKLEAKAEKDAAKVREKLDSEAERHRTRLAEILREDVLSLVPCELCRADLAGWVETATPLPDEVKQRVRIQIGDREPENWQEDPHSARCSACDGLGEVQTGSRVRGQEVMPCVDCGGKGWQPTDDTRSGFRPAVPLPPPLVPPSEAGNGGPVNHPALGAEDHEEIKRLRAKGIVVVIPERNMA